MPHLLNRLYLIHLMGRFFQCFSGLPTKSFSTLIVLFFNYQVYWKALLNGVTLHTACQRV